MNDELISVIVSIYNEDKYVERCINSIINQSYQKLDIILVDDGSVDDSVKICRKYAKIDKRINVVSKENGGLVSSRKMGILCAKGNVIVYMDGDDWLETNWIKNLYDLLISNDADIVIAGFKKDLNGLAKQYTNIVKAGVYERDKIEKEIVPKMMYSGRFFECGVYTYLWNKMFRKSIIEPAQLSVDNDIFIGEDAACVYPAILQAKKIVVTEMSEYHYCIRPNSAVRKKSDVNGIRKLQLLYKHLSDVFSNYECKDMLLNQLFYFYVGYITLMSELLILEYPVLPKTYPFGNIRSGTKVILYSAGAFGVHIYHQFTNNTRVQIVGWIDPFYDKYSEMDMDISSIDILKHKNFDYVIIASIDAGFIEESKKILSQNEINSNCVITIHDYFYDIVLFSEKMISSMGENYE